jgi:thiamine biosynthesis lipoprotein
VTLNTRGGQDDEYDENRSRERHADGQTSRPFYRKQSVVEGVDPFDQFGRNSSGLDGAPRSRVRDGVSGAFAGGRIAGHGRTPVTDQGRARASRIDGSAPAGHATEASVSSAGDTHPAVVIAMLHEHHFRAMNTDVGVWLWSGAAEHAGIARSSFRWAQEFFGGVEAELSRFRDTSALNRLNQRAGQGPQKVPRLLWTVLEAAFNAANDSGGIYDPTLCRTIERLGYDRSFERVERAGVRSEDSPPPAFGAWRRVRLDGAARSVSLPSELALDLGGIAKGWTVDQVALALAPLGPVLVDAGGDLRMVGTVNGAAWPIAVQDPFEPERDRALVGLRGGALATSSRGGRCWRRGSRTLHHVIDPRSGTSATSDLHTVTVYAPDTTTADVAAKVALVLGRESGTAYLAKRDLSALLTSTDGREIIVGDFPSEVECHGSIRCA